MILLPITYLIVNVIHARYHAYLADVKKKIILSRQKTFEYGIICVAVTIIFLLAGAKLLPIIIFPLLTRAAVFDIALNKFRKKHWLYEGQISRRKSFWDWLENKIGLPTWCYRILYILIYIIYFIWNLF